MGVAVGVLLGVFVTVGAGVSVGDGVGDGREVAVLKIVADEMGVGDGRVAVADGGAVTTTAACTCVDEAAAVAMKSPSLSSEGTQADIIQIRTKMGNDSSVFTKISPRGLWLSTSNSLTIDDIYAM